MVMELWLVIMSGDDVLYVHVVVRGFMYNNRWMFDSLYMHVMAFGHERNLEGRYMYVDIENALITLGTRSSHSEATIAYQC